MGNPHVVFFVPDVETAPVREVGPMIEHHRLFPEGVNVGFAQIVSRDRIRLKVWERGAGLAGLRHRRLRGPGGGLSARPG